MWLAPLGATHGFMPGARRTAPGQLELPDRGHIRQDHPARAMHRLTR